ncbi:MAG TPA: type IV toxin-antitoxin system AbiEi family antitoxin domain-containing protein, partial [Solirubrobacteraceae bacterium]|nr:type IV toxin-antitoxin system AbiEi family antitoxin domain-containing protein [Solirubrobacteraceae bacterium]
MGIEVDERPQGTADAPARRRRTALEDLAARQHGAISRRQLTELGFTRHEIAGLNAAGWLHRVFPGVYALGRRSLGVRGRWMAAVLAGGPGALLSHRSSAALQGIRRTSQALVEITVPSDRARAIPGIRTYRCAGLRSQDRALVDGIPCTSVALTLLGLAAATDRRQTGRACDEAEVQGVFDMRAVEELLDRASGRRGIATLRAVLEEHVIGTTLTRSELEERALDVCRRARLPLPKVNEPVACGPGVWHTVDFFWPQQHVILEADGHRYHRTRRCVERDRRREADLVIAGNRVLRTTWLQVEREPHRV